MPSTVLGAKETQMDNVVMVPGQLEFKGLMGKTALTFLFNQSFLVNNHKTGVMRSGKGDHCTGYPTGLL